MYIKYSACDQAKISLDITRDMYYKAYNFSRCSPENKCANTINVKFKIENNEQCLKTTIIYIKITCKMLNILSLFVNICSIIVNVDSDNYYI